MAGLLRGARDSVFLKKVVYTSYTSGAEVVELGPINASIHKIDEHVSVADLFNNICQRLMMTIESN